MKIKHIWILLLMLPLLFSCQSEDIITTPDDIKNNDVKPLPHLRVTASLPAPNQSRAQITYGNPDVEAGETFKWTHMAYMTVFNLSRLDECPKGLELETVDSCINGNIAIFETLKNYNLRVLPGDTIFVNLYQTGRKYEADSIHFDPRKIFTIVVGTEANKPQYIVENPTDESLSYMKDNLKMYDVVVATDTNAIPDLHFKHLSAILRVSLHNATGKDLYPTKLEFKYPGTLSFFNTTLYCSVLPDDAGGFKLFPYETDDFFNGTEPYTDNIGTTINGKEGTTDAGGFIKNGDSYDLYITTVPKLNNEATGDEFSIHFIVNHDTDHPYIKTIKNFNVPIQAGKRYWFNLTATPDTTLMFTKDWEDLQKEKNENSGEETTPES